MSDDRIDDDAKILATRIPESRNMEGLVYGTHVSRAGSGRSGYYVWLPDHPQCVGVAWLTPDDDELPELDDRETPDAAIVRCIREELGLTPDPEVLALFGDVDPEDAGGNLSRELLQDSTGAQKGGDA